MKKYTVVYDRDAEGAVIAEVAGIDGCHSYGRSLLEARKNIREALELWLNRSLQDEQVVEDCSRIVAPAIAERIEEAKAIQEQVERLPMIRKQLAAELASQGFSTRDVGWLIGVAHQRVHQYVQSAGARTSRIGTALGESRRRARRKSSR